MKRILSLALAVLVMAGIFTTPAAAQPEQAPPPREEGKADPATSPEAKKEEPPAPLKIDSGDTAWMLASSALVMFMVPGLALFYGGMVRRKNVLATMMQSMVALAVVGVYWIAIGYCLAFGSPRFGGLIGWNPNLIFLKGIEVDKVLPGTSIPIYVHMAFQGMFAIITPALISGALAERIRFGPYCLFLVLWVTFVYCPLAHMVWAMNWWDTIQVRELVDGAMQIVTKPHPDAGKNMVGVLGKWGALDFAGGTVVHIAAGLSGLGAILVLRKRLGYPEHVIHPNSMVLTLLGAGLLWFGWFGFNGGSALGSNKLASSAFCATQAAAAAAALSWMLAEWMHKGKPTALGWASGVVAGLVAVTPASGYIYVWGGLSIGLIAGVVCYVAVCLKPGLKYDDSLDAFGVHGVGGFLGAVLTGVFCYASVNGADGMIASIFNNKSEAMWTQVWIQLKASVVSVVFAFILTALMIKAIDEVFGLITDPRSEIEGLDRSEHGEVGFDLGLALESSLALQEPKAATLPPDGQRRFTVVVDGPSDAQLRAAWSKLCQTGEGPPSPQFKSVYPYMTLLEGNRFHFRGGDPHQMSENLQRLFQGALQNYDVKVHVQDA